MPGRAFLLVLLALTGCVGQRYSIEAATPALAAQRAQRYCGQQDATAQLEAIEPRHNGDLNFYRCIDRDAATTP